MKTLQKVFLTGICLIGVNLASAQTLTDISASVGISNWPNYQDIYPVDWNNDGCMDFIGYDQVFANPGLFINNCDGTFSESSYLLGDWTGMVESLAAGDINNDTYLDFAVIGDGILRIFTLSNGTCIGVAEYSDREYRLIKLLDVDNNGDLEIISLVDGHPESLLLIDLDIAFSKIDHVIITDYIEQFNVADLDNDGFSDVIVTRNDHSGPFGGYNVEYPAILKNTNGTFSVVTNTLPMVPHYPVSFIDYNNDALYDFHIGSDDWIYNGPEKVWLFRNDTNFSFSDVSQPSQYYGWNYYDHIEVLDVENDGDYDYFQEMGAWNGSQLLVNNGGNYSTHPTFIFPGGDSNKNCGVFDFDGDGDLDALFSEGYWFGPLSHFGFFRNEATSNFLAINPVSANSQLNTYGIRVVAFVNGLPIMPQMQESTYGFTRQFNIGLGSAAQADSVVVHWPGGATTRRQNVAANQFLTIYQGQEIDSGAPAFSNLLPVGQPTPAWQASLSPTMGATVTDVGSGVDGSSLAYRVDWNANGSFDAGTEDWQDLPAVANGAELVVSQTLSLPADGQYQAQLRASDLAGNVQSSPVIVVRADATPPSLTTLYLSDHTPTSLSFAFGTATDLSFSHYELRVSTDAVVDVTDPVWGPQQDPGLDEMSTTTTTVAGLNPGTAYWIRLYARDLAGNVNAGSNVVHKVTGGTPVAAITDLHATRTADGVLLAWSAPTVDVEGLSPVAIERYQIHASMDPWFTPSAETLVGTTTDTQYLVGLSRAIYASYRVVTVGSGLGGEVLGSIRVEPGTFTMGPDALGNGAAHSVTLTHPFWMDEGEVTNQRFLNALQWALGQGLITATATTVTAHGVELVDLDDVDCEIAFDPATQLFSLVARSHSTSYGGPGPAYPNGYDPARHPAKEITWYGAACYCDWRSLQEGLTPFYNGNWTVDAAHNPYAATGYRLPTEAEWEYAARYNDGRLYPWGATVPEGCNWANLNCVGWTKAVGLYPQGNSALGFRDLIGNVLEYTNDIWAVGYTAETHNPMGPTSGTRRSCRGTDMGDDPVIYAQATTRQHYGIAESYPWIGFRTVRCEEEPVQAYPGVLIRVPAGTFQMGQAAAVPVHSVTLTRDFLLGKTEVTVAQYRLAALWAVAQGHATLSGSLLTAHGQNLAILPAADSDLPMVDVSWYGAACYTDWLCQMEGLTPFYNGDWNATASHNPYEHTGYRLPMEAEWEYACRAGSTTIWCFGESESQLGNYAWYPANSGWSFHEVGLKLANAWGLHDMHGNLWEWCQDWHYGYSSGAVTDPMGASSGSLRVTRGGAWDSSAVHCYSASRNGVIPTYLHYSEGFRLARTLP